MPIFSNPIFIRVIIAIGVVALWIGSCWFTYIRGHRRGYTDCLIKMRSKRRSQRKLARNGDIRILNPTEPRKRYAEAESVRVVATHAPKLEEEDRWM